MNALLSIIARCAATLFLAVCIAACTELQGLELVGNGGVDSFMGVHFGASLSQTQMLYPLGSQQTSPYGADAYELRDVDQGGAKYESVVFEFTPDHGMQLVIARFTPGSRDLILQQLGKKLPAEKSGASDLPDQPDAAWKAPNGVRIDFYRQDRRLVLVGPYGKSLEPDIALRKQFETY